MICQLTRIALTALLLVGYAGTAQAYNYQYAELALDSCDAAGCEGSTLFLSVQEVDTGSVEGGSWLVTYTINTEYYTGGDTGFNQIGFKAIKNWDVGMVTGSPEGSMSTATGGDSLDPWNSVFESPVSANSLCDHTSGNSSHVCIAGFVDIRDELSDGTYDYTWTFLIEGGTLMDSREWSLSAQYANGPYRSEGQVISGSGEGQAPMPEPSSAVLFGLGAILVARSARRR